MTGYIGGDYGRSDDQLEAFQDWCDHVADFGASPILVRQLIQDAGKLAREFYEVRQKLFEESA